jgi:hypothetical protein
VALGAGSYQTLEKTIRNQLERTCKAGGKRWKNVGIQVRRLHTVEMRMDAEV